MLFILAFLLWETSAAGIPESLSKQAGFVQALGGEWLLRYVQLPLLGFVLFLVAIGPKRALAWASLLSSRRASYEGQHAHDALDAYLNQMQQWLNDESRPLVKAASNDQRRKMARTRTLTVLGRLGPEQKGSALRFLQEHDLINEENTVIHLNIADFSGAALRDENLIFTHLTEVNLSGADLSEARLSAFQVGPADLTQAIIEGFYAGAVEKPAGASNLELANLSNAVLRGTVLAGCNLLGANLTGAKLDGADLRGADLRLTQGLTQKQIDRAHGGTNQLEPALNTLLPDHLEAPAAWNKPIYEQRDKERHFKAAWRIADSLRRSWGVRN